MDGYVNDLDPGHRQGLHARAADEVVAWDSVVGHHLGLSHALTTFLTPITKRIDEPVFEVYRHGIVHGMVVNFDNAVVACKAWNMLFAVNDWAASMENAARPAEPTPTWSEIKTTVARHGRHRNAQKRFVSTTYQAGEPGFSELDVVNAARSLLDAWQRGQWALVAVFMPSELRNGWTEGRAAKFAKDCFEPFDLTSFELVECRPDHPSAAGLVADVTCNGTASTIRFRMAYWTGDGRVGLPGDGDGSWRLAVWAPDTLFRKPDEG
jgi:hypothetical protein